MSHPLEAASVGRPITRVGVSFFPTYLYQRNAGGFGDPSRIEIVEKAAAAVPTLEVHNTGDTPVLLAEGETVSGGRQNRLLTQSILVPASATIDIPVSCVEQGRWHGGREFSRSTTGATRRVRRTALIGIENDRRRGGTGRADQSQIWATVDRELTRLGAVNDSSSFHEARAAIQRDNNLALATRELLHMGPLPGQNGLVIAHGSRVVSFELFASAEILERQWEALVAAALLDAPGQVRGVPSATKALSFINHFASAQASWDAAEGIGERRRVASRRLVGQSLELGQSVVHASAFALAG